jgi:hypothetical protein
MDKPKVSHLAAVKRILRNVKEQLIVESCFLLVILVRMEI